MHVCRFVGLACFFIFYFFFNIIIMPNNTPHFHSPVWGELQAHSQSWFSGASSAQETLYPPEAGGPTRAAQEGHCSQDQPWNKAASRKGPCLHCIRLFGKLLAFPNPSGDGICNPSQVVHCNFIMIIIMTVNEDWQHLGLMAFSQRL